jgi:hypothetical protein
MVRILTRNTEGGDTHGEKVRSQEHQGQEEGREEGQGLVRRRRLVPHERVLRIPRHRRSRTRRLQRGERFARRARPGRDAVRACPRPAVFHVLPARSVRRPRLHARHVRLGRRTLRHRAAAHSALDDVVLPAQRGLLPGAPGRADSEDQARRAARARPHRLPVDWLRLSQAGVARTPWYALARLAGRDLREAWHVRADCRVEHERNDRLPASAQNSTSSGKQVERPGQQRRGPRSAYAAFHSGILAARLQANLEGLPVCHRAGRPI